MIKTQSNATSLQTTFLSVLPRIETHARFFFRDVRCAIRKADCIAEVVAICWKWFSRIMKRGKDATRFISAMASLAARAVKSGRRACGGDRTNDVMSPVAQRRHNFVVQSLTPSRPTDGSTRGERLPDEIAERLVDNRRTPVPEQAAFRLDFRRWVRKLSPRERKILRAMSRDERTKDLSQQFQVSQGRISQIRREFKEGWSRFVGDEAAAA